MRLLPSILKYYPFKRGKGLLLKWFMPNPTGIPEGAIATTREQLKLAMRADPIYCGVYLFGEYEPQNTAVFRKLIQPGHVIFDIGANFGWYTTLFAKLVGPSGRVNAFEPQPAIVEHNRENLRLNALEERVILSNLALGAQPGILELYSFAGLSLAHSSCSSFGRDDATKSSCPMSTLDAFVNSNQIAGIDIVKIDVEGYEADVFQGGADVLGAASAPLIVFEISMDCLSNRGMTAPEVQRILSKLGYNYFWEIHPFKGVNPVRGELPPVTLDYIAAKDNWLARVENGLGVRSFDQSARSLR